MTEPTAEAFLQLVSARRGHFRMESGLHAGLWLDLDGLFANSWKVEPFVDALVAALEPYEIEAVCGPMAGGAFLAHWVAMALGLEFAYAERVADAGAGLYPARYRIPAALASRLRGKPVALVDDVMSAGSSLRATWEAARAEGAHPIVVGTLLALGTLGTSFFESQDLGIVAVARADLETWPPEACAACRSGLPLEDMARASRGADPGSPDDTGEIQVRPHGDDPAGGLMPYWFPVPGHDGIGVTATSLAEAAEMATAAAVARGWPLDPRSVQQNVDVATLGPRVAPDPGDVRRRGVWFPRS